MEELVAELMENWKIEWEITEVFIIKMRLRLPVIHMFLLTLRLLS